MACHNLGAGCGEGEGEILTKGVDSLLGSRVQPLQPIVAVSCPAAVQICMCAPPFPVQRGEKTPSTYDLQG